MLFDAIYRENGIEHLLTQPRSPTTTGKIERFHRSMRAEFLSNKAPFSNLRTAQQALDEWVDYYNTARPHQSLDMATQANFTKAQLGRAFYLAKPVAVAGFRGQIGRKPSTDPPRCGGGRATANGASNTTCHGKCSTH